MDGHIEEDGCSRGRVGDGEAHMKRQKVVKYVESRTMSCFVTLATVGAAVDLHGR